jgi:hypothetical protein
MPGLPPLDTVLAAGIAAVAAAWLLWKGVQAFQPTSRGSCGCGGTRGCGPGPQAGAPRPQDARRDRMNRVGGPGAR